ncbi:SusD/RagB family nutrient-binding outer membrane lipoprotein [Hymenobacter sp. ISL-91]|uniref:SusD/RagB family nutrient-binding outer membrane lipoprotein n=1 Tax=Hymenobacter sp. ISL-91 TaxID=2819151 RepID=UPI001BEAF9ED|nr:SusD/RagB family nutrient-binding outer membrane lipoprotein [Hymenobacter sp. ISL-91]MBT2557304.1 SusD/RagB family nutrient-binding outer membrane lipoprotein [Hymenobacter sp. ISL-91]
MKKILFFILPAMVLVSSCVDSLDDYNIDPKRPQSGAVPGVTLVSSAERSLARTLVSSNVNLNVFRLYTQYWAETTYFDESIYQIKERRINEGFWTAIYRDVLRDLQEARVIISANNDPLFDPAIKANQLASIEVLEVYSWATLVDLFGDVPYTDALDVNKAQPKYDKANDIYNDLIVRLDKAILALNASASGLGNADLYYNGDVGKTIKFANSLKLRLAMTIADVDPAKSQKMVSEVQGKLISSSSDNAALTFLGDNPNTNPLFEDLVQSGRNDFVGTSFFIDKLNMLNDPRVGEYFKPAASGDYEGGEYGTSNSYDDFSAPGTKIEDPTLPSVLISYSQVEFMLAEAAARGYSSVSGTAKSHYDAAVRASIIYWGGTSADATAYLAQPEVDYNNAASGATYKEKIGIQKWISLYNQPVDSFREYRRLDYPQLTKPAQALSNIPRRFPYPAVEQNLNGANYNAAAAAIGGDNVDTKIFWDKF